MSWYILEFRSGNIIRLSTMLSGHGGVIERLDQMGFKLD
jgi:predicted CDP-diglyceride synthetase/phosphatidate cytidylyltransferase